MIKDASENTLSLRDTLPFKGCEKSRLDRFLAREELLDLPGSRRIVKEGTPADGFYYIHSGVIKLSRSIMNDAPSTLSFLGEGDVIGLDALVDSISEIDRD